MFGLGSIANNKYLTLSYRKASAPTDLIYTTELNDGDLLPESWTPGGVIFGQPVSNGDGTQTITIRDEIPISPSTMGRFIRLRVNRPN
jgi:hypothetical protein